MPDPTDTLMILVDAAVAVAGFSGVVVVFGRRSAGAWSKLERTRLVNLLSTSFSVLFFSLGALVLLHAELGHSTTWRIGSVGWSVVSIWQIASVARAYSSLSRTDPDRPHIAVPITLLGLTAVLVVLNLHNAFVGPAEFWPFLAALVWLLALAWYSFAQLLLVASRGAPAAFYEGESVKPSSSSEAGGE